MALTCKILIDCQQVFLPVTAENASSKEKKTWHLSEIFLTSRVRHTFATSVQDCQAPVLESTSVPRCISRHLEHRRGSFPAPTECSTASRGWEWAFPSNTSLGTSAVLDPTAKQPSCWENSQTLLNSSGWANDLLYQLCGIYFYFYLWIKNRRNESIKPPSFLPKCSSCTIIFFHNSGLGTSCCQLAALVSLMQN